MPQEADQGEAFALMTKGVAVAAWGRGLPGAGGADSGGAVRRISSRHKPQIRDNAEARLKRAMPLERCADIVRLCQFWTRQLLRVVIKVCHSREILDERDAYQLIDNALVGFQRAL
jgi:hypothetical protein